LREFIELLSSRKVEYVIVGGHAVAFHGYPRFTGDIDFFVRPTLENGGRLVEVLEAFGFGNLGIDPAIFAAPKKVIQLGRPPNRIDLITGIDGIDFEEAWQSRVPADLGGVPVFFLGRDALVRNKRAAARPKDLLDLEKLEPRTPPTDRRG
jgi:hypothetical protein